MSMLNINGLKLPMIGDQIVTGDVRFVDENADSSVDDPGQGKNPERTFNTLDYAIGKMTTSKGDFLIVQAGHTETYSAAGKLVFDKIGLTIIGLGGYTTKPTFTLDTAVGADVDVTAADTTIKNMIFTANFADVAVLFDLSAKGFKLIDVDMKDTAGDMNFTHYIDIPATANACDGLMCVGCTAISPDAGSSSNFIYTAGDIDGLRLYNNYISLGIVNDQAIIMAATGKDFTNVDIKYNSFERLNASEATAPPVMYSDTTANSGIAAWNAVGSADADAAKIWDVTGVRLVENYVSRAADKNGVIIPTAA